ncbi:hypothetical protein AWB78_02402 [Caballeronia calidae]|uniref:Uncharacterized protein n=1 Tax=Caballeronia calidae TaxID=1777139 RepID=A0A158B8D5_9BURK|nr:hypothetical protein AWB78_02402 [Caballeronia calidae]
MAHQTQHVIRSSEVGEETHRVISRRSGKVQGNSFAGSLHLRRPSSQLFGSSLVRRLAAMSGSDAARVVEPLVEIPVPLGKHARYRLCSFGSQWLFIGSA